uniref:Uncharacterized protein n=1 Tax=Amphimedon queenslandica TaxID=400682 RepID=A0A1X7URP8_AMPQE
IYCSVLILKGSKSSHTQDDMINLALPTFCFKDEGETDQGKSLIQSLVVISFNFIIKYLSTNLKISYQSSRM